MRKVIIAFLSVCIVGCASVDVNKVDLQSGDRRGFCFYMPYPYLMVTRNSGELKIETIYLPKINEMHSITMKPGLGSANVSFAFKDGWQLTQFNGTADSKTAEILHETLLPVSTASTSLGKCTDKHSPFEGNKITPGLYRYQFDDNGYVSGVVRIVAFD